MNVLVDTSVWVAHFQKRSQRLVELLDTGAVICHPFVIVEVAAGTPRNRLHAIESMSVLDSVDVVPPRDLIRLIERLSLFGRGCGMVDLSLLAAALANPATAIWTLDRRLAQLASENGCGFGELPTS